MKREENRRRWEQRLAAWQKSGLRLGDYCHREGLPVRSMYRWHKRLQREALEAAAPVQPIAKTSTLPALVPIQVGEFRALTGSLGAAPIEIRLRGGRAIVIHDEVADARLARLIGLVERAA
jgi:hypothetical protein